MNKLKKAALTLIQDNVLKMAFLVTMLLLSYTLWSGLSGGTYMKSYETDKDLPDYSMSENTQVNPLQINPAVVRLHTSKTTKLSKIISHLMGNEEKENEFFCTGFIVSNKYMITAGHCLESPDGSGLSSKEIEIYVEEKNENGSFTPKSTGVIVKAAGINRRGDTGLVIGDFTSFKKVKFSPFPSDILQIIKLNIEATGGQMISIGFPYGDAPLASPVKFIGTSGFQFRGVAFLYPGASGGPLIDPITGYAIGVNSSVGYDGGSNFASLIGFLESLNVKVVK